MLDTPPRPTIMARRQPTRGRMTRTIFTAGVSFAIVTLFGAGPRAQLVEPSLDLTTYFGSAGLVRDTNGDGLADSVATRIIVPAEPTLEDSLAAANLAGRLGFETTALTLPLVVRDTDANLAQSGIVPVFIGRDNRFVRDLAAKGAISLAGLLPGQGLLAVVRSPFTDGGALVVAGGDDKGTLAAATMMAARLPRLWNMTGITLDRLADQVRGYLARQGLPPATVAVTAIVVDSDRRGIRSVSVRAALPANRAERAVAALRQLDHAHRRGLEPQTLNFAEIAVVSVDIVSDGRPAGRAEVARAGLNPRTLTRRLIPTNWRPIRRAIVAVRRTAPPRVARHSICQTHSRSRDGSVTPTPI